MHPHGKTFQASGFAPDMVTAEVQGWGALTSVLGPDSEENWSLRALESFHVPPDLRSPSGTDSARGGVQWVATYVRDE